MDKKKWNIKLEDIEDKEWCDHYEKKWAKAKSFMEQRTKNFSFFTKISHGKTLYSRLPKENMFSEGSTQSIKRKVRAQTIQRIPDGKITTQFDKNSIEHIETEFIFRNKILESEFDGKDMLKNLWRTFNAAYDYGFGCVRTGFETDVDNDVRVSYKLIQWNDVFPAPDCDFIEEAEWYFIREYISYADLWALLDENEKIIDNTYNEDVVKYLIENEIKDGIDTRSAAFADREKGALPVQSVEIRTFYRRGSKEFKTWVPSVNAILRTTKNYDPRLDVPLHFMILEPDPEFPLGCSSIMWTLAQQQFADAFQSVAYDTLLLAANPPIMGFGNLTNAKIRLKPNAFWNMGTNPNNKVEKFPVETTTITQYGAILQNVSANMMKNLNITDGTVASDAKVMAYSATPQGVQEQHADKTITINQFQKRVEIFFAEWSNHALRSYINAMGGQQQLTVDEDTRRKIWDVEKKKMQSETEDYGESIIDDNKITIDFDKLSSDLLSFQVRPGSLVQSEKEQERKNIQELIVPISQMMGAASAEHKPAFEKSIMQLVTRLCELSDVDLSQTTADNFSDKLVKDALDATIQQVIEQQQQIQQLQQATFPEGEQPMPEEGMPAEMNASQPQTEVSAEFPEGEVG